MSGGTTEEPASVEVTAMLPPLVELLSACRAAGIRLCHFKSNEHLIAGLTGETDLDLLADHDRRHECETILARCGFRSFRAIGGLGYPGVADWIGYDHASGKLLHLHLHWRLVLGERHLKGYRIPWEHVILASAIDDESCGFPRSTADWEMLLLLIRSALKARYRDYALAAVGESWCDSSIASEFPWLLSRCSASGVVTLAREYLGVAAATVVESLLTKKKLGPWALRRLRRAASETLNGWKTHGRLAGFIRRHVNEVLWLIGGFRRRYWPSTTPSKRVSPGGGIVISVIGCDGSGKSTLVKELRCWLRWKLDVVPIYHGSGDGQVAWYRWPLWFIHRRRPRRSSGDENKKPSVPGLSKALWAIVLAWEKTGKLRRQIRARNLGGIVVADRYPQTEVEGFNDGPLLGAWREAGPIRKMIAAWERKRYHAFDHNPPDLVLRLDVEAEVAFARKPEGNIEEIRRRVDVTRSRAFPSSTRCIDLDASRPFSEVLAQAKSAIWDMI